MADIVKRDESGRFVPGTTGGPGRPRRANQLRSAMLEAVTEQDIIEVTGQLLAAAKRGEPWAVRELLDRATGKPQSTASVEAEDPEDGRIMQVVFTVAKPPEDRPDLLAEWRAEGWDDVVDADGFEVVDGNHN